MLRISAGCLAVAIVALAAGAWILADKVVAPVNCEVGSPPADLIVESVTLESESGSKLATWYIPVRSAHATVVVVHGIGAHRGLMLDRARMLHDAGYATVLVDLRAHGESSGEMITLGHLERYDVQAAVDFARKREPTHRIGLIGVSLGGAAALLAPALDLDALVVESVYATIDEAIDNRVRLQHRWLGAVLKPLFLWQFRPRVGITADDLRPIDHIGAIGCPVLVATGENDVLTPVAESRRLYDAASTPKEFVIFKGIGHENFLARDPVKYQDRVLKFFAKYLRGEGK
jgi:alpha-beta hydrolase superfamily lysophospholipase